MPTVEQLQSQLNNLQKTGFDVKLAQQAKANGFAPSFFYGIASRETNCVNMLGDRQADGPHGVGIIQIDIQHDIARQARDDGSWQTNPDPLIAFGAQMLAGNIRLARKTFPQMSAEEQLKVAASGYNCGMGNAIKGARNGDSDQRTAHGNYGADVMARMKIFEQLLGAVQAEGAGA